MFELHHQFHRFIIYTINHKEEAMILSALAAYLPYALITTFTPGPNNLISFYAVSSRGWKKGANVMAGIGTAILLIMLITAVFSHQISAHMEAALPVLKYFGAAYILWLACKIARSGPENSTFEVSTFWKGFILVFINIKMLL
jgi:cysteine/O-acetylserine efflux protein